MMQQRFYEPALYSSTPSYYATVTSQTRVTDWKSSSYSSHPSYQAPLDQQNKTQQWQTPVYSSTPSYHAPMTEQKAAPEYTSSSYSSTPSHRAPLIPQRRAASPLRPTYGSSRPGFVHANHTTQVIQPRYNAVFASNMQNPVPKPAAVREISSFLKKCDHNELIGFWDGIGNIHQISDVSKYVTENIPALTLSDETWAPAPAPAPLPPTRKSLQFSDLFAANPFTCDTISSPMKAPGMPQCYNPRPAPVSKPVHEFTYSVSREASATCKLQDLSFNDEHYWTNSYKVQRIGFRFSSMLSPTKLMQSLQLTIEVFPVVGSKVIFYDGHAGLKHYFHLDEGQVCIRLINVEPHIMDSIERCEDLCETVTPQSTDQKQNQLFECWLFKSSDISKGSILVVGFQHTLGDATSYGLFMRKWSEIFQQICTTEAACNDEMILPPGVFTDYARIPARNDKQLENHVYRSFAFSDAALAAVKRSITSSGCEMQLSTNDILCAQCAIAIAPTRFKTSGQYMDQLTRIFILCDGRGSLPAGSWGNHVTDVVVDLPWRTLLKGNVKHIASLSRKQLLAGMDLLKTDNAQFRYERSQRQDIPKLFVWNSWAKPGDMLRSAQFRGGPSSAASPKEPMSNYSSSTSLDSSLYSTAGTVGNVGDAGANLLELRWFNSKWSADPVSMLVSPLACPCPERGDARIAIHVASPLSMASEELQSLLRFWHGAQVEDIC